MTDLTPPNSPGAVAATVNAQLPESGATDCEQEFFAATLQKYVAPAVTDTSTAVPAWLPRSGGSTAVPK